MWLLMFCVGIKKMKSYYIMFLIKFVNNVATCSKQMDDLSPLHKNVNVSADKSTKLILWGGVFERTF